LVSLDPLEAMSSLYATQFPADRVDHVEMKESFK